MNAINKPSKMIKKFKRDNGMELLLEIVKYCVIIGVVSKDLKRLMNSLKRYIKNILKKIIKMGDFGLR
jgi:hypothetical protein